MYNKNAWASLWNKRKLPQGNMIPCIPASMNLSPSVHEDKEEQCSSIMNSGDKQSPLPPHFGSNRSWGQRGRTGFLKPFRHFYMTELINSLLIPRGVRHNISTPAKVIHAGPLSACLTLISVYSNWLPTPLWLPTVLFLLLLFFLVLECHMSFSMIKAYCI